MIEYGRYRNIKVPRENRRCIVCNLDQIENETHLILSCSCYNKLRENMKRDFKKLTNEELCQRYNESQFLSDLMNSKNPSVIRLFSKFISKCFYTRKCKLNSEIKK